MIGKSTVLEANERDPLFGYSPEHFVDALRTKLNERVEAAYLFGSFGTPRFHADSDVDLILVKQTHTPFIERPREFFDLLDLVPTIDVLVYTPEEFERLTRDPGPGFWNSVVRTMQRIL